MAKDEEFEIVREFVTSFPDYHPSFNGDIKKVFLSLFRLRKGRYVDVHLAEITKATGLPIEQVKDSIKILSAEDRPILKKQRGGKSASFEICPGPFAHEMYDLLKVDTDIEFDIESLDELSTSANQDGLDRPFEKICTNLWDYIKPKTQP